MKQFHAKPVEPLYQPWEQRRAEAVPLATRLSISIRRAIRWEFWPAWLYYLPIVLRLLVLSVKYRSLTVFTAANPGISTGGLVGEEKVETLLPLARNATELLAPFELIRSGLMAGRQKIADEFIAVHGLPCVLKPNVGQRGRGVFIARTVDAVRDYLLTFTGDVLVQRYVEGDEYGVFIAKQPSTGELDILSIVNKVFPTVIGDGRTPLRQLILTDDRASLTATSLFHRWSGRLDEIVPKGKVFQLVEIGAHCRGSLFLDATGLSSPALLAQMRKLTEAVPGYFFGRVDLRVPDAHSLHTGQGIQVLEINGVAAESAHIYNPDTPLKVGYRAMFRQWERAYEIGHHNALKGAHVTGPWTLLKRFVVDLRSGQQWF